MPCEYVQKPDGGSWFICTSGRRALCSVCRRQRATRLCDGPGKGRKTCDAALCTDCSKRDGEHDLCPACARKPQQAELFGRERREQDSR